MKKIVLLLAAVILTAISSYSQAPTLTGKYNPVVNDVFTYFTASDTAVSPGIAGANQTWDFSAKIKNSGTTKEYKNYDIKDPYIDLMKVGSNPVKYSDYFQSSTVGVFDNVILYYTYDNAQVTYNGKVTPGLTIRPLNESVTIMKYPFTYGSSFTDKGLGGYPAGGFGGAGTIIQTAILSADAWGKLILPNATYDNTLRVRKEYIDLDSTNDGSYNYYHHYIEYAWYDAKHKQPVLKITSVIDHATKKQKSKTIEYYSAGPMLGVNSEENESAFGIYPNPVIDNIIINNTGKLEVNIYNIQGQMLMSKIVKDKEVINVSNLNKGLYIIEMKSENNIKTSKFIKS